MKLTTALLFLLGTVATLATAEADGYDEAVATEESRGLRQAGKDGRMHRLGYDEQTEAVVSLEEDATFWDRQLQASGGDDDDDDDDSGSKSKGDDDDDDDDDSSGKGKGGGRKLGSKGYDDDDDDDSGSKSKGDDDDDDDDDSGSKSKGDDDDDDDDSKRKR